MLKFAKVIALSCALFAAACAAQAQTARPATIDDAAWLAGRWVGEGFDGQMEEAWAPPVGGQMIGHFRYWRDGQPQFYEFMVMDVVEGGVRMRLKHFNPDLTAWEDRESWTTFEPVSASPEALIFNGLTIRREGEDRVVMTIRLRNGETVTEHILRFQRAPL
ncbi:MAG: hypothetical protein A4S17_02335 [Proteobacteria bacterium HN_bin10]|nr:MAG: hypothetical protein A4S17_02335 [Proteobacteria bacterium HN_bin10]